MAGHHRFLMAIRGFLYHADRFQGLGGPVRHRPGTAPARGVHHRHHPFGAGIAGAHPEPVPGRLPAGRYLCRAFRVRPGSAPDQRRDAQCTAQIQALWRNGDEVEGWARYWNHLHAWLADRLAHDAALRAASLVVQYDTLCERPEATLGALFEHCRLAPMPELLESARQRIHFPDYYRPQFERREIELIRRLTGETAQRLGLRAGAV